MSTGNIGRHIGPHVADLTSLAFGELRQGWLSPFAAALALAWLCVAILETALFVLVPSTAFWARELPAGARLSLLAYDLALLAVLVAAAGCGGLALGSVAARQTTAPARWAVAVVSGVCIWVLTLLYGVSWAAFWNAGVFLDRAAFAFWAPNPVQVFHWVYPPLTVTVIVLTAVAAVGLGRLVPRVAATQSVRARRHGVLAAAVLLAVCTVTAVAGGLRYGAFATPQVASAFGGARDLRTGPVAHATADVSAFIASAWAPSSTRQAGDAFDGRQIISMDEYLSRVDRGQFMPMNVVMLQIESLRADQLRAYGGTRDVMPNVDALARESRVFSNAYVQASHSNYADLVPLLSQHPLRERDSHEYPENPSYPRLPIYELLKAAGYRTAVVSSQNERWGGMINLHRPASLDFFFHAEVYKGPTITPFEDGGFADWVRQTRGAGSVDDRYTVDEAIRWIDSVAAEPFFVHMNLQSSHVPYVVPEGFDRPFGPDELDFTIMWGRFPRDKVQIVKDRYADSLFYEDTHIGRLFDHLKKSGEWDNTIVIIGGDNGEAFYEHDITAHASTVFQEVVKVPMVIRVPGIEPGADDRPAMFLDVPPSILDLLGLPAHPAFQGISLFERSPDPDRPVFTLVQTPLANQLAVIRSGYKLILPRDGTAFLFDLSRDPGEFRNIAAMRPDIVDELSAILNEWRDRQLAYYADTSRHSREYPP